MLQRIDHVNLVVRDLERMVGFYTRALGMGVSKRVTISGGWIAKVVGLAEGVEVKAEVVYLELKDGPRVELIRYVVPAGDRPANLDKPNTMGLRHIAFAVDDIDAAVKALQAAGAKTVSEVQQVPDSQVTYAGGVRKRLVYFHDPEGNLLELCEYR